MDLFETNVDLFRAINDLGKEYTYLNNFFIFTAEYMVFLLCILYDFLYLSKEMGVHMDYACPRCWGLSYLGRCALPC